MKKLLQTPLDPQVLAIIQHIGAFCEGWERAKELDRDLYANLKRTTIITSAGSSTRIEGAHLSDEEIAERLKGLQLQRIRDRDDAEVAGYIECLHHIFDHYRTMEISEHEIRSLHQMMCRYLTDDVLPRSQRGAYKNITNAVVRIDHDTGEQEVIFETTPPGPMTDAAMRELVIDYNTFIGDANYADLEVIAAFIVKFLAIHPFRDGNGRIARLLTNLCLLKQGYDFCQYASHEKVIEDNKTTYYIALRQTQASLAGKPDLNPWLLFFLRTLERQTQLLRVRIAPRERGDMTELEERVVTFVRDHQPVSIGFLERNTGIKRVTLKSILARLKERGVLRMEGERKGSRYSLSSSSYR